MTAMKYGVVLPGGTAREQLDQAVLAEESGWDGVFSYETAYGVDPWTLLAAMAARTSRVRLGTDLTPLPWRRPWKVASQVATLDQISGGRAILGVGIGAADTGLPQTGEELGVRERAALMDEGIDLIRTLWSGGSSFRSAHYEYESPRDFGEAGKPVQDRVPIWVVGVWPRPKSMRRVLKCDGVLLQVGSDRPSLDDVHAVREWLTEHGSEADVVVDGESPAADPKPYADAGATWWLETRWGQSDPAELRARIADGPR